MSRPIINDNGTNREMTAEEEASYDAWKIQKNAELAEQEEAISAKEALKNAAIVKLGLTEAEVKALFE